MVFSLALLIVFAGASKRRSSATKAKPDSAVSSSDERLGTAYRLSSGEVVCVPDNGAGRPEPIR